jgi:nucleoid-associated protein YgaU
VTVRPGDSLWRIAAAHLDRTPTAARVAAAWPQWFAANRDVIGADPDLLVPGEVLHAPHTPEDQR